MFYLIFYHFKDFFHIFNLFKYTTFRSGGAFITAFLLVFIFEKSFIEKLIKLKAAEHVDMYGHVRLESIYRSKEGTPTMGGILILLGVIISIFLWCRINRFVWLVTATAFLFGILGIVDDYLKIRRQKGLRRWPKLVIQMILGVIVGSIILYFRLSSPEVHFPFFKNLVVNLGWFYIFWVMLILVSSSNAVNFTDGLDGLAIGSIVMVALVFGVFSYISANIKFSQYLFLPYVKGAEELTVISASLMGAGLGFLWFNAQPAELFMGDVGSLSLGAIIGLEAILVKEEFILLIAGGIFVIEALSVLLQIVALRVFRRRIFKAAPLHHHFQMLGWDNTKITIRFWIVSSLFVTLALLTLKLR